MPRDPNEAQRSLEEMRHQVGRLDWLWPHQRDALLLLLGHPYGIVRSPTASGKTSIVAGLCGVVPGNWVVLVPRSNLVTQTIATLRVRLPIPIGTITEYCWQPHRVTVATWQGLAGRLTAREPNALAFAERLDGVVFDEVQSGSAPVTSWLLRQIGQSVTFRYGLSATPFRRDERDLFTLDFFGRRVVDVRAEPLRQAGRIATPTVRFIVAPPPVGQPAGYTWHAVESCWIEQNDARNRLIAEVAATSPTPGIILLHHVQHGQLVTGACLDRGLKVTFVSAHDPHGIQQQAIADLRAGRIDWLVATPVFDTGVDIPELRTVVNAAGGQSAITALQTLGRGARVHAPSGKTTFLFIDIADIHHPWLRRHVSARVLTFRKEGYNVEGFGGTS